MAASDGRTWPDTTGRRLLVVGGSILVGLLAFVVIRTTIDSSLGTAAGLAVGVVVANVLSHVLQKRLFGR